ncbi:hypothetical protein RB594_006268 [Gaeumannomyces avenae]
MQDSNSPPRLGSMQPPHTQDSGRARDSLDETCSNYEYELGDRQPIEELVARNQNVLDGLKDGFVAQQPEYEANSEGEYEVDSDYGSAGGPIGRMPSRRFGSRSSRKDRRGKAAGVRSLAAPEPVAVASMALAHGVGTPRDGPSIRPLPLAIRKTPSGASTTGTSRARGPSRKLTVRKRTASQKPSLPATDENIDSFGQSWARMSHLILRDLPGDPAKEHSQEPASHQPRQNEERQYRQEMQQPPQQTPMAMPRASNDSYVGSHSIRPSMDRPRNASETRRVSPTLVGRQSSSYHRRLDEKTQAFQGQGDMVEIPIVDDDGTREMNSGRNRALSLDSQSSDQRLPPYSKAPPTGHRGLSEEARAMAAWADAERASIGSRGPIAHGFQLAAILLALVLAIFVVGMNINIIATAVPRISRDFGTFNHSSWYGAAFLVAWCAFQAMFGRLYSVFPVKWVFSSALLVFELGSLLAGVSPNSHALIAGRAIQGIGAGGVLAGAFIISALLVPLSKRPLMGGLMGALEGAAMITAPIIGGAFTDQLNWRWSFYVSLPVVPIVAGIIILCLHVPPEYATYEAVPREELGGLWQRAARLAGKLDLVSSLALVPAVTTVLLALQWGGSKFEWTSGTVVSLLVVSILFLAVFCYCQHLKQDLAMVPPRIFTQRTVLSGFWFMLCTSAALVVVTYFLPLWFQVITNASPSNIGIRLVPMLVAFVVGVLLSGAFVSFTGHYAPLMLLGTILMSVGSGLLSTWTPMSEGVLLAAFPAIFGAGCGIAFQQPMVAAQSVLGDDDMPIGISVILFGQAIGTALALSVAETVFSSRLRTNISDMAGAALGRHTLIEGGAQGIIKAITESDGSLAQLMKAYNKAITQSFYVPVAMASLSVVGAVAIEWRNVKREEARRRREAELIMNEKQGPRSTCNLHPHHQRSFMAHSIDPCQAVPYNQQQQQQQQQYERYSAEADATRPQPYDRTNSRMGSPYDQPASRMGSPYGQSHHQFGVGAAAGQPAPYATQQSSYFPNNANAQPGLGLDAGNYSQAPASYYEKAPVSGR